MRLRKPLRLIAAVLTAGITTWIGLSAIDRKANANTADLMTASCTQSDIAVYHDLMEYPEEEATPAYVLAVSEAFLETCSEHPDARKIRLQAAEAALNAGHARATIRHLEAAQAFDYTLSLSDRFRLMAALAASGRETEAWIERDEAVEAWLAKLSENGLAVVETETLTDGVIYAVQFSAVEEDSRIRAIWLAVPDGDGWPAAVNLGSDSFRAAMHAIRASEGAPRLQHVDLVRCRSRYTLGKAEGDISVKAAERAARPLLEVYLRAPDRLEWTAANKPVASCIWPQQMMPQTSPWKAVMLD